MRCSRGLTGRSPRLATCRWRARSSTSNHPLHQWRAGPSPHDGARLREGLIDADNTASDVWADSAYRSAETERFLAGIGKVSRIHRRKPKGKPMPKRTARANAKKSTVRAHVEHPFAHLKGPMGLVIRTIGIARATATVTLANMAFNMKRWRRLDGRSLPA